MVSDRNKARDLCFDFNSERDKNLRNEIIKNLLGGIGEGFSINPSFKCDYGHNIHIGGNFYMNYDCIFLDVCPIIIGDNCMIGPGVHIYTAVHPLKYSERNLQKNGDIFEYGNSVVIGDNVWIGGRAVICPGVAVGSGVVIGAGSIVAKDIPDNFLYIGDKIIKKIDN